MHTFDTEGEARLRSSVRQWAAEELTHLAGGGDSFQNRLEADRRMAAAGYLGIAWPKRFGGGGGNPIEASIVDEECARRGMPRSLSPSRFGINLLGPAVMEFGDEGLQGELLPPILRADTLWCQGFSESEAGSDLANVQAFATEQDGVYRLSGSKIWTTQAHEADWCFALARTSRDLPRHKGLSMLLFPLKQEGVTVRPIRQINGDSEFNEVFFDGVRVERRHVLGGAGNGWAVAMRIVAAERSYGQMSRYNYYRSQLARVVGMIRDAAATFPRKDWERRAAEIFADLEGIKALSWRTVSLATAGQPLETLPSMTKLWWSRTHQQLVDLGLEVSQALGLDVDEWFREWLTSRAESIYAGTTEVQLNIVSERTLGLPREGAVK